MNFLDKLVAMARGEMANAHRVPITQPSPIGYNNQMIQRPVVGVGNAPQYWSNAFFVGFNSIAGGGTIAGNAPAAARTVLDFQMHTIGAPTQNGTLTPSRELIPLAAQPNFNVDTRR